jgi:transposase
LDEHEILYILLNPIISYQAKKSSLRKVKTDAIDAFQLCVLYYKEDFEPHKNRGIQLLDLRNLSRQQEIVTNMYVEAKLQFHTILDQVFPEYRKVFGDLYSKVSLLMLKKYPTSEDVMAAGESKIAECVMEFCPNRSSQWALDKAKKIMDSASRNPFQKVVYKSHLINLQMYIELLFQYQGQLSELENHIVSLANELEDYQVVQSISGTGEKIAATIISEIGEIDQFNHPKKLVAFAGVDPSVHSSGKFTATTNRITKRGSSNYAMPCILPYCAVSEVQETKSLKNYMTRKNQRDSLPK